MADKPLVKVGGQAVMEGVMMRSPKSFAVAVRRENGEIVLTESPWRSLSEKYKILRIPFFRGSVVLIESMVNGISALNFSARVAISDEEKAKQEEQTDAQIESESKSSEDVEALDIKESSDWMIFFTVILAIGLGVGLFIALPHLAVWLSSLAIGRELSVEDFLFHAIVGVVKFSVFLTYIGLISLMKDVKRLFMYHGAEHQSIYAYEAGLDLTVENARRYQPLHPRCGTTFMIMVIAISILVFSIAFPLIIWLVGEPTGLGWLDQIIYIGIKLPLLLPIAGIAYELQRFTSRHMNSWWARLMAWPGMMVQRMTTRPPTDDQLEVALTSLRKSLWREEVGIDQEEKAIERKIEVYGDFSAVIQATGKTS
jgi:uncharacterized protein YqhQ